MGIQEIGMIVGAVVVLGVVLWVANKVSNNKKTSQP